jgi:hypothetical protein
MKKIVLPFLLILMLMFGSCLTLPEGSDFSLGDKLGDSITSSLGLNDLAVEMQALQFYALYFSYAFYGGYSYETGFAEGQGLRWRYTTKGDDGSLNSTEYERVFLKDLGDNSSWWRLEVEAQEDTMVYEYLVNQESEFLKIRFKDPETGEIVEYIPEAEDEMAEDEEMTLSDEEYPEEVEGDISEEEYESYNNYEYIQVSKGEEKITVPAGTFKAEHMVSEVKDDTDKDHPIDLQSDWWIAETVPGGVVKYIWKDNTRGDEMNSVLVDILDGQTTRMNSY